MREQLIQYVNLLFAGAADAEEIKMEILQNTLDRYDDLITQGKSPEAAYRLAISGIGDINEILGDRTNPSPAPCQKSAVQASDTPLHARFRAIAVGLYIISAIPVITLGTFQSDVMNVIGLCGTLVLVAVATVIMIICRKPEADEDDHREANDDNSPKGELRKSIESIIWAIGLAIYFILSFTTGAWYITWIIFPIIGAVQGLAKAIMDLKEAN